MHQDTISKEKLILLGMGHCPFPESTHIGEGDPSRASPWLTSLLSTPLFQFDDATESSFYGIALFLLSAALRCRTFADSQVISIVITCLECSGS